LAPGLQQLATHPSAVVGSRIRHRLTRLGRRLLRTAFGFPWRHSLACDASR